VIVPIPSQGLTITWRGYAAPSIDLARLNVLCSHGGRFFSVSAEQMDNRQLITLARQLLKVIDEGHGVVTTHDIEVFLQILLRRQRGAGGNEKTATEETKMTTRHLRRT